ncbi:Cas10/Cmr2 second palm domain-containing protein [Chloroflexus sp.]
MPYLLAAEADKIQDFIFRSSRLREVVGASQLLTRFCRSIEDTLAKQYNGQVVVNDGGSFRVIFDDVRQAIDFGNDLSELYRLTLGGSLTVAEPVEMNDDFADANKNAAERLRWGKNRRQGVMVEVHMPYVAFCESCGVGLAERRDRLAVRNASRHRYLCATCQIKAKERDRGLREFLGAVYDAYAKKAEIPAHIKPDWPEDADAIAELDLSGRNYVAYLVADGNGMGQLFGSCDQHQLQQLSQGLSRVLSESLAVPMIAFRKQVPAQAAMIPMLPLILGGDDLFALIPAPYALDIARRFCLEWEKCMQMLVNKIGLHNVPRPTIAAAVVICKGTYPYTLAHRRAKALLEDAKRQSKLLAAKTGEHLSAVNFEVILGNRLAGINEADGDQVIQRSLRPYWVAENDLSVGALQHGIDLRHLLAQRYALKDLPRKRLAELRRCFAEAPAGICVRERTQALERWTQHRLEKILERLSAASRSAVVGALEAVGKLKNDGNGAHYWRRIAHDNRDVVAHGIPDLLEVWEFAQDLSHAPDDYEPQEEEA